MIRARDVRKRFGAHAVLRHIDLRIDPGERVALLGLNGAGKTTLIRCLLGLIPFEGALTVAGLELPASGREARARIGYVPQRAPHFDGPLGEIVEFVARLRGADPKRVTGRLAEYGLALEVHGDKPVRTLSGGMLQKTLLALALSTEVPLLLLDEPTANLDPRARRDFLRSLRDVDSGTTILLASHRLADVEEMADRLLVLHGGTIAFDGTLEGLWRQVGAVDTVWVKVPPDRRAAADSRLRSMFGLPTVLTNGAALGVQVKHAQRVEILAALHGAGIEIDDFWTESPSLHDLLEVVIQAHDRSEGSP